MIEEALISYGGIGILCLVLLYILQRQFKKEDERIVSLGSVINNNTAALAIFCDLSKKCVKVKK